MMTTAGVTGDEVVIKWNNAGVQIFNYIAFSLGIAINIGILATRREQIFSLVRRPDPRLSSWRAGFFLIATFLVSLVFVWVAGFVQYAVGLARNASVCQAAILLCISAYALTKITTNLFLLERLWLVSAAERWQDARLWQTGVAGFLLGMPLLGAFFASFKSKTTDNICHVGLHAWGSAGLITWDAVLNLYLSLVFAWQCRGTALAPGSPLRLLALKTLGVTAISTTTSIVNLSVLTGLGYEVGYICLSCCMMDILVDALTLALLTNSKSDEEAHARCHRAHLESVLPTNADPQTATFVLRSTALEPAEKPHVGEQGESVSVLDYKPDGEESAAASSTALGSGSRAGIGENSTGSKGGAPHRALEEV